METRVFRWLGVAAGVLLLGLPLYGQADMDTDEPSPASVSQGQTHLGFPQDWSSRHLVIAGASIDDVLAAGNYDPRYAFNAVHRMVALRNARQAEEEWRIGVWGPWPPRRPSHKMKIDWAVSLENGYVAQKQFPAKFQFGITAESCSSDYIMIRTDRDFRDAGQPGRDQQSVHGSKSGVQWRNIHSWHSPTTR